MSKQIQIIKDIADCFCSAPMDNFSEVYGDAGRSITSPGVVTEGTLGYTVGIDQAVTAHTAWRQAFPEIQLEVKPLVTQQDLVIVEWHGSGVNSGDFMDLPATNKMIQISGLAVYKFQDNKIIHQKNLFDIVAIAEQLEWSQMPLLLPSSAEKRRGKHQELLKILQFFHKSKISLTKREVEVLSFWVNGCSAKEIGNFFNLSYRTVQTYIANIMAKLECYSRSSLFAIVHDHNVLHLFRDFYDLCIMTAR